MGVYPGKVNDWPPVLPLPFRSAQEAHAEPKNTPRQVLEPRYSAGRSSKSISDIAWTTSFGELNANTPVPHGSHSGNPVS